MKATPLRATFGSIADGLDEPMLLIDIHGRVSASNVAARQGFGFSPTREELLLSEVVRSDDALNHLLSAAWRTSQPVAGTLYPLSRNEPWRCWAWRVDADGDVNVLLRFRPHHEVVERFDALNDKIEELGTEIHRRRATEERLRRVLEESAAIFGNAPIGMAVAEIEHIGAVQFQQVNPAMVALTGYSMEEFGTLTLESLVQPDHWEASATAIAQLLLDESATTTFEAALRHADGERVWVTVKASLLGDERRRLVLQMVDMTERRQHEAQLQYLADHDPLTGLANRRRFEEDLHSAVAHARRYATPAALLVIDLDNFKGINDTHGHAAGDEILRRVAHVLQTRLRETDVIGRLGGDEFAVVLAHTELHEALIVAEDLRTGIRQKSAFSVNGENLHTTATIGIAAIESGVEITAEQWLVEADVAMYEAKEGGGDRVATVDPGQHGRHRVQADHRWLGRIREALDSEGFVMVAQPILDLHTGAVNRYELLLRLEGADGELIPPGEFLHIAERFRLIQAIDRWVVTQAISVLEAWQLAGCDNALEVNISGASMTDPAVIDFIEQRVWAADFDARLLVFEITETAAIVNMHQARTFAERLSLLGCQFALDDFGSGFGSFRYLKHFPTSCLKIDGEFIRNLTTSETDQVTVKAIVEIAAGLGKHTVAEFVEDSETMAMLEALGVDYVQGYHIGKPASLPTGPVINLAEDDTPRIVSMADRVPAVRWG